MVCTEPLPKLVRPMTVARLWSCSAPETISEAEAEPPLMSIWSNQPIGRCRRAGTSPINWLKPSR